MMNFITLSKKILGFVFAGLGLLIFLGAGAWAVGVRIHPKTIQSQMAASSQTMVRIDLKSGRSAVGAIIEKSNRKLTLDIEGGKVDFDQNEIRKITELDSQTAKQEVAKTDSPFLTMRAEDSLFHKKKSYPPAAPSRGKAPAATDSISALQAHSSFANALAAAEQLQGEAHRKQREIQEQIRKEEQGY